MEPPLDLLAETYAGDTRKGKGRTRTGSALALGAVVGAPVRDPDHLDRGAAPPAGQTAAAVHLQLVLVLPGLAEQVEVCLVAERGAAVPDGLLHDLLDGPV